MLHNSDYEAEVAKIMAPVDSFVLKLDEQSQSLLDQEQSAVQQRSLISIIAVIIIVVFLIACYILIEKRVIKITVDLVGEARIIASGDLRERIQITGSDELAMLGRAFNEMGEKLSELLNNIQQQAHLASDAAGSLNGISQESSTLSLSQNQAIDVIASSVHENQAAVSEVSRSCNSAANAAEHVHSSTSNTQVIVSDNIKSIQNVSEKLLQATDSLSYLHGSVKDVTEILSVIDSIAEQTNLLALNAAIEAARAGEQGRGFAVVADEVRNLAKRSQTATEEIQNKLNVLQQFTDQVSTGINSSNSDTKEAVEKSQHAGNSLLEIKESVTNINDMNQSISAAAEEQEQVSKDIAERIEHIRQGAEESNNLNKSVTQSANELSQIATKLNEEVNRFQL
ncbi:methyl-accepting chemotaxis protein [Colwelliaceae bacterium 6441]